MKINNYLSSFISQVKIDPADEYAVNYWSEKFDVSPFYIAEAIRITRSNQLPTIVQFLKRKVTSFIRV
ncbi:MAG: DUF3606 domain-containing protein [Chitinophagales bacterium]